MGFGGLNSTLGEFDWGLGELGDRREEAVVGFGGGGVVFRHKDGERVMKMGGRVGQLYIVEKVHD